MNNNKDLCLLE